MYMYFAEVHTMDLMGFLLELSDAISARFKKYVNAFVLQAGRHGQRMRVCTNQTKVRNVMYLPHF